MLGQLKGWEWLIIVALILLLFGAKKLPDTARGLGRSLRIFKAETKGLTDGGTATENPPPSVTGATGQAPVTGAPEALSTTASPLDRA